MSLVSKFQTLSISTPTLTSEQTALESQWNTVLPRLSESFAELNSFLRDHTYLLDTAEPTATDAAVFEQALPLLKERLAASKDIKDTVANNRHTYRWAIQMQQLLEINELVVDLDIELPREVIEKKKKEAAPAKEEKKEAAPAKKEKKEKEGPKGKPDEETLKKLREEAKAKKAAKKAAQPQQQEAAKPVVSQIDFRVGFIQKAIKHPDADALYVSTIDCGDEEGPRTVCSGLVKHFPLEAMQERFVVVVCNLKPVNMRGVKSSAMVLCGSTDEKVEFVEPPQGSKAGDKVFFEGFDGPADKQLNPKKKIWETFQPGFTTLDDLSVVYKDEEGKVHQLTNAKGDKFRVASIAGAQVR